MHLFISIWRKVLNTKLTNIGKQAKPLIPIQCLVEANKFQSVWKQFLNHFDMNKNMNWNKSTMSQSEIHNVAPKIIAALDKIEYLLLSATTDTQYPLFTIERISKLNESNNEENEIESVSTSTSCALSIGITSTSPICNNQQSMPMPIPIPIPIKPPFPPSHSNNSKQLQSTNTGNISKGGVIANSSSDNTFVIVPEQDGFVKYNIVSFNPLVIQKATLT